MYSAPSVLALVTPVLRKSTKALNKIELQEQIFWLRS